jgi:hypothetical protein
MLADVRQLYANIGVRRLSEKMTPAVLEIIKSASAAAYYGGAVSPVSQ